MEIKKIVVDELPKNCGECIISCESTYSTKYYCHILKDFFERWEKPKECPLEVEEECVSTVFEQNYQTVDDGEWHSRYRCRTGCGVQ